MDAGNADREGHASAMGETFFAAMVLTFLGISHLIAGLSAIFRTHLVLMNDLNDESLFAFSLPTWGWIHLATGVLLLVLGAFGLFSGGRWVRPVAVVAVILSAITALAWLSYLPFWAIPLLLADTAPVKSFACVNVIGNDPVMKFDVVPTVLAADWAIAPPAVTFR